ncbi:MAG TPA: oxalyl-CoA decarboxylase, partial [Casimicrobiaceae bacterium]
MESATAARPATAVSPAPAAPPRTDADTQAQQETDGFHLLIDALKLNGIETIFGLPGIPITDLTRQAQAAG